MFRYDMEGVNVFGSNTTNGVNVFLYELAYTIKQFFYTKPRFHGRIMYDDM